MVRITLSDNEIIIKPTERFGEELFSQYLVCIAGSKYDSKRKLNYTIAIKVASIIDRLTTAGFAVDVSPDVHAIIDSLVAQTRSAIVNTRERANTKDLELASKGRSLYPFQKIGMAWLASKHAAILSDEMGLGKTIQMLMALPDNGPVLIVCPKLAKGVWKREAKRWRPEYWVRTIQARKFFSWPEQGEIVICNYDIIPDIAPTPLPETIIVGDEIHATKNPKSKRTNNWRGLVVQVQQHQGRAYGLTGTPLLNEAPELWGILSSLGLVSESFGTWSRFAELMGGKKEQFGRTLAQSRYVWTTPTDPQAIGEALKPVMLRRLRTEVLPELPTKTWETLTVIVSKHVRKTCDHGNTILGDAPLTEESIQSVGTIGELAEARKELAEAKIPTMLEIVENHEEQKVPLIVFSAHLAPIEKLKGRKGWAVITGETSHEDRTRFENDFQAGRLRGLGGTIRAAGAAITLTRAYRCLFVDRDWTPANNENAEDRVCRIGQDRGVQIIDLVADHPLDSRLYEVLRRKKILIASTIEQARQTDPIIQGG